MNFFHVVCFPQGQSKKDVNEGIYYHVNGDSQKR